MRPHGATVSEPESDTLADPTSWVYLEPTRVDTAQEAKRRVSSDSSEEDLSFLKRTNVAFTDEDFEIIKQSLRNQSAKSKARREKARSALEPTVPIAKPVPEKPQLSEPFFKAEPEGSPGEMKGVIMDQAHERATPQGKLIHFDRLAADAPPMDRGRRKIADALDKAASPSKQPDSLAFARKKLEKESALKRAALEQCFGAKHFREFLEKNNQRVPPALAGLSFSTNE